MASNNERLPPHHSFSSLTGSDDGDSRRLQPTLSNSTSDDGRYSSQRLSGGSTLSQQSSHSLDSARYQQARQPINEAVTSAFNNTDATSAGSFSPELLHHITSQITANVLQQLKGSSLPFPTQQPPMSGAHNENSSSANGSPPLDRATVYTPPTPHQNPDENGASQPSPQFPPPPAQTAFQAPSPPPDKRATSPLSQFDHLSEPELSHGRPKGPRRISTGGDPTIVERVWGQLFTEQGNATLRLGQFLRGIAMHLIEDYDPKNSLVITPAKMQRYYEETKLPSELYPWKLVFDDRTSSISRMFREIECQHHLVQEKTNERPELPGLTPQGFETWTTLLLRAHPDQEFERLAKTALDMPISNPDEKKERFPKEISRRLFPAHSDTEVAYKLQKALSTHCKVNLPSQQSGLADSNPRGSTSSMAGDDSSTKTAYRVSPEKQDSAANVVQPSLASSLASLERDRQPYGSTKSESVNSDFIGNTEDVPTPQPIERERKPYVAVAGAGKTYENIDKHATAPESRFVPQAAPPSQPPKLGRSGSVHASNKAAPDGPRPGPPPVSIHQRPAPAPVDIPEPRHHRSNSNYYREPARRNRSPSISNENGASSYVRRTDPDVSYLSSSHHSDHHDDARRYRDFEGGRERLAHDRYDAARMSAYDPRERERERDGRQRLQSVSNAGTGFVDGPRSPTMRNTAGPPVYPPSNPGEGDDAYYLKSMPTAGTSAHYNGHSANPASISTGFQPPPQPGTGRDTSTTTSRDIGYAGYSNGAVYPPNSYRDAR